MLGFLRSVVEECREAGKVPGIQAANGDIARDYAELGFDMITIASDAPLLTAAVRSHLGRARGAELSVAATTTSNY
jgi:2-keto-3-deoxy-L-rhamnonate aldolase RhmA